MRTIDIEMIFVPIYTQFGAKFYLNLYYFVMLCVIYDFMVNERQKG